jgi:hypothetical protein
MATHYLEFPRAYSLRWCCPSGEEGQRWIFLRTRHSCLASSLERIGFNRQTNFQHQRGILRMQGRRKHAINSVANPKRALNAVAEIQADFALRHFGG